MGTQVSGLSTGSPKADRDSTGEFGEIQDQGSRVVERSPQSHQYATAGRVEPLRTRLVGLLPTGHSAETHSRSGGLGPPTYPEMLLVAMARHSRTLAQPAPVRASGSISGRGDQQSWRLADRRPTGTTAGAEQLRPESARLSLSVRSCRDLMRLGSTAGCGKPHVRWCGRVAGRNPRHSTRSGGLPHIG